MRILVVDDSQTARDVAEATLMSGGYEDVTLAESAADAIGLLALESANGAAPAFDVILSDVVMPDMDGIELCARIRQDPRYADVPILMVTSLSDTDSLSQAFVSGATDYVTKPFQRVELLARVRNAVSLKGERDRRRHRESQLDSLQTQAPPRAGDIAVSVDARLALPDRGAAELLLNAFGEAPVGDLGVICAQIDHLDRYAAQYPEEAARLPGRVTDAVRGLPARLDTMLASYAPGVLLLICPGMEAEACAALADQMRASVEALRIPHRDSPTAPVVTLSVGAAAGGAPRKLLSSAISAAELAADQGGNRILIGEEVTR